MPHMQSLRKTRGGFLALFALFSFLESLNAHLAIQEPSLKIAAHPSERLVDLPVEEMPDISSKLQEEGVKVAEVGHLNQDLEKFKEKYLGAQKRLMMIDNTDALRSKNPTDEEKTRLISVLTAATKDTKNEIWVFSGQAMLTLLEFYEGVPKCVNFAAEWGAHLLFNERNTEQLIDTFDLPTIKTLINKAIQDAGVNIYGANFWPGYQRMHLVGYQRDSSNPEAVQKMVDQLYKDIESHDELRGELTVTHNAERGYFSIQRRKMGKGTLAMKLLQRNKPDFVVSIGDSAQDETMHRTVKDKGFYSVVVSSKPDQKTFAEYKLGSVGEVHDLLEKISTFKSQPSK